ncbi:MAG: oxygen-independent coproporphyrinogen III oxidase [Clostridia bacterium]|nr:oxygen-independent coproporphyrinogen III oxidase [Clostridia bacterium]
MKELGIYVHIPFCKSKCSYCDFTSFANKEKIIEKYIECLKKEIKNKESNNCIIDTIYIGGGTPSFIESKYIKEIVETIKSKFKIKQEAEITIEINPGTVNEEKLKDYKKTGINRISIGLQSTNNKILKQIGRIHTYEEFLNTYNLAKKVGFKNINVDLMLALPSQTLEELEDSIQKVIKLEPKHISVYSLIIEEGTKMQQLVDSKKIQLPSDELERKMYWNIKNKLEENGYIHYEISNFSKKGFESKHNTNCWNQKEYLGLGLSAHSYINNERFCNTSNIEEYIKNVENNNFKGNIQICEIQNEEEKKKEYMLLALRKLEGVNIGEFKNKFVDNPIYLYRKELEKLVNEDLIEIDLNNIKLTNKGLDLANLVWKEFV